ncbi:S8 family serine peptidase [Paenimyroides aestuarii]|uniref:S8 family serine peptidase n=1 Tax=Paenimyroides aestuarii TaxID=2968490 RepID=A0ABY5NNS0_9FLAO|nr:S8 family serine peptidase [Paenimyroides aestuarii]UUV20149.1 S8 family serine peptidase [Paenimyroides aestuarii]
MKNKITKLFLALLAFSLGNGTMQAQEEQRMPDYVLKATNIEYLKKFAQEKAMEYEMNYKKAVEIARSEGKPISGEKDGNVFALFGYDEETGGLIYNTTFNVEESKNIYFNNSAVASSLQTANAKPLHAAGIEGAGMITGVWDGGAGLTNHVAFTGGRYQIKNNANNGSSAEGRSHAAHVAGTVAAGEFGDNTAKGFAYEAIIHAYNGINVNDIPAMTTAATTLVNPIYVSNHSYGLNFSQSGASASIFGQYSSRTRDYDELANNAKYYTIVFAAGNDRDANFNPSQPSGKDLLSQAGVSKNVVVVAATQGTEDFSGITGATSVVSVAGVGPFMSSFSNYGPTDDFRIKPDISAKGVNVKSVDVSGLADTSFKSGTSMAAPSVTGVFTLWQGYHNQVTTKYMKSASVRALMAHTARETGPSAGPDFMFGWGLIDAAKGVEIIDEAKAGTAIFEEFEIAQGTTFEYEFSYDGVEPLVATIAWNDPAGTVTPSSTSNLNIKKLVNDLDLRLINMDTNQTYYPWSLVQNMGISHTSSNIATRLVDNARDNIEKIEPQNAAAGNYKLIVSHKGTLQGGMQEYSLIISGAGGIMPATDGTVSLENEVLNNLTLYPNPVNTQLNIEGDLQTLKNANIAIFDVSGKKVKEFNMEFNANNVNLDVSELNTGIYMIKISKENVQQSYKFIKK